MSPLAKAPAKKNSPRPSAKKPASSGDVIANRERPQEPVPYKATKEELLEFYKQMLLIRRFEEKAGQLYGLGLIGGFCHLYIGQEAVAIGLRTGISPEFISFDMRQALYSLGEIIGTNVTEDILTSIFSTFCIGK